jgi:APA family basic amino acid/polyamine antiporter
VSALVAIFGTLNGWILIQAQVPKAAADDDLFPKFFAKTNKQGTPYVSLLISGALMTAMLYMNNQSNLIDQFTTIAIVSTFAVLLPYLYSSLAELYFLVTKPHTLTKMQYARSIVVTLIAFAFTIVITAGAGESAVFMGMIFVFSGFPFYVWMKARSKKKALADISTN